jgi:hypothetical protein
MKQKSITALSHRIIVQVEVVCPSTLTPAALVNDLKERTLSALQEQFPDLQQQY